MAQPARLPAPTLMLQGTAVYPAWRLASARQAMCSMVAIASPKADVAAFTTAGSMRPTSASGVTTSASRSACAGHKTREWYAKHPVAGRPKDATWLMGGGNAIPPALGPALPSANYITSLLTACATISMGLVFIAWLSSVTTGV